MCQCLADLMASLVLTESPERLRDPSRKVQSTPAEIKLVMLATRCRETAIGLQKKLRSLRLDADAPSSSHSKMTSLLLAVKLKMGNPTDRLQKKLDGYRNDLMLCLKVVAFEKQSSVAMYMEELKQANLNIVHDHSAKLDEMLELIRQLPAQAGIVMRADDPTVTLTSIAQALKTIKASSARQWIWEHEIVHSLYFESLPIRHEAIQNAHRKTFEWLLRRRSRTKKHGYSYNASSTTTLLNWLQSGAGIYWVSGKPGSGKSTLMKFVVGHPETQKALNCWAKRAPEESGCITTAYYFWSAGTRLQKSVEGLLRSLLFEVLVQAPDLIPVAFPKRWAVTAGEGFRRSSNEMSQWKHWGEPELFEALRLLSQPTSPSSPETVPRRLCFFIDGLDEYHGNHRELALTLSAVASFGQNIKVCVSSRPRNVLDNTIGLVAVTQKLLVHELTRDDIAAYTNATLDEDPNWVLEAPTNARYGQLVRRSLQEGLTNGDSLHMLEKRVYDMPQELGPFLRKILMSVPTFYQQRMAIYFHIALNVDMNEESSLVTLMHLSFLDDCFETAHYASSLPIKPMDNHDIFQRHSSMRRRLNARCKGLLEAHLHPPETQPYLAHRVILLHRTVRDFLRTDEMTQFLDNLVSGHDTAMLMLNACIALFKSIPQPEHSTTATLFAQALSYARRAEVGSVETAISIVNELLRSARTMGLGGLTSPSEFTKLVVHHGVSGYIAAAVEAREDYILDEASVLDIALQNAASFRPEVVDMTETVSMLLSRLKAKPPKEMICLGNRAWCTYMQSLRATVAQTTSLDIVKRHKRILGLILPYVADVNVEDADANVAWGGFFGEIFRINEVSQSSINGMRMQMIAEILVHGANPNAPYIGTTTWLDLHNYLFITRGWDIESDKKSNHMERLANITEMFLRHGADTSDFLELK
ncbi:hypothetical protein CMQ_8072 [Grosmannia clavigera kw1407]|uniref:NACHT domain-containing protein n=1 Tax=Grosmannia clavigera (strain kw1407 / UAMH 11150) TaxID=655863 RepID=F0XKW7_GROCL|nr:uncharacterized protein CMQ_8072 [Grosmannia clavigera kw1407]EFX01606.1 hypothetical protein CMQ_8072 [Grosmannia clavigera kw1407]